MDKVQYASAMSYEEKKRGALTDSQRISTGAARYRGSSSGFTAAFAGTFDEVSGIRTGEGRGARGTCGGIRGFVITPSSGTRKGGNW